MTFQQFTGIKYHPSIAFLSSRRFGGCIRVGVLEHWKCESFFPLYYKRTDMMPQNQYYDYGPTVDQNYVKCVFEKFPTGVRNIKILRTSCQYAQEMTPTLTTFETSKVHLSLLGRGDVNSSCRRNNAIKLQTLIL